MDQYLIQKFGLVSGINDFTPIDEFKVFRNFDAFTDALKEYASSHELTDLEQYFFKIQTDPRRRFLYRLSQNHFSNYFLSIYFILSNPVLITKPTFANLYHDRHLLPAITDHIIELYETMDSEAARFYNKVLLDKFANNLDFVPLSSDSHGTDYGTYFELFSKETARLKAYIDNLAKDPKWIEHTEQGLSQFDPSIYQFAFEHYTGLTSVSTDEFPKIKQWAQKHLDYLMEEVNQTCNRLLTDPKDKEKSTYEKMILIGKHPSQQWSSKQEMIEAHETSLAKYRQIFIDKYGFKEFNPPGIVVFDNPTLTGGYYYKDKFYLNVYNWIDGSFKYEVESLTLHETIPGHHMQLDISYHSPHRNYLAAIDSPLCNGFIEGWGLFSEHLGDLLLEDPWAYFGYLQANILRTFRIIAEILLHVEGQSPSQVIELAKQYLTTNEESITAEIYRYRVHPGQACGYKIGLEVFKRIVKHKFNVDQVRDFIRSDLLEWYKDVLWKAERPLDLFLRENGLQWSFDE